MNNRKSIIERLASEHVATQKELTWLIASADEKTVEWASGLAREVASDYFGRKVYLRGLVEVTNRCMRGCYYCGLRAQNLSLDRYELSTEQLLSSCRSAYHEGALRSLVMQGGERYDMAEQIAEWVRMLKREMPDVAITLSLGEQSPEVYDLWRRAGADRYLLRHETANSGHYAQLHPKSMSHAKRLEALEVLHRLGYQRGAGFMVGSPYQSEEMLAQELAFLGRMRPEMVGIGPFIPQSATPFASMPRGGVERTLLMIALTRLTLPKALIPSTTALASVDEEGTIRGIMAGANVVMPNITPVAYREAYAIYDGKKVSGTEAVEGIDRLRHELLRVGYTAALERGDHPDFAAPLESTSRRGE